MAQPLLQIRDLKVEFDSSQGLVKAVNGLNLEVRQHEIVGLVGESGSGKTTTAHAVNRLIPSPPGRIVEGRIFFKGRDLTAVSDREIHAIRGREIAQIFQDPMTYLNPVMKVRAQLEEMIRAHMDLGGTRALEYAVALLDKVRLPSPARIAASYPHELSGGMRQRVLLAMAISCNPSLIIADEPTSALDATTQLQILDLLKESVTGFQSALLLICHDLGVVAELCDRVYVIYCGRIVESGNVYLVFENPRHPYTRGLLQSALSIAEPGKDLVPIEGALPNLQSLPPGCAFHPRCSARLDVCSHRLPEISRLESDHQVSCWLFSKHE